MLVIQSAQAINPDAAPHIMTILGSRARDLRYEQGGTYRIAIDANPTISQRRIPKATTEHRAWLATRLRDCATVLDFDSTPQRTLRFAHPRGTVTLARATISASVRVTDPTEFARLAKSGVGRGRAYGLGLMLTSEVTQ